MSAAYALHQLAEIRTALGIATDASHAAVLCVLHDLRAQAVASARKSIVVRQVEAETAALRQMIARQAGTIERLEREAREAAVRAARQVDRIRDAEELRQVEARA